MQNCRAGQVAHPPVPADAAGGAPKAAGSPLGPRGLQKTPRKNQVEHCSCLFPAHVQHDLHALACTLESSPSKTTRWRQTAAEETLAPPDLSQVVLSKW